MSDIIDGLNNYLENNSQNIFTEFRDKEYVDMVKSILDKENNELRKLSQDEINYLVDCFHKIMNI